MVTKLSDYLNYLYNEVIQARKQADLAAIEMAKEYANHEYLKYFKAPRFTIPSVKMEIPIKITDIDGKIKYDFEMDDGAFIENVNKKIGESNAVKDLDLKYLDSKDLQTDTFKKIVKGLEQRDQRFVAKLTKDFNRVELDTKIFDMLRKSDFSKATTANPQAEIELNSIMRDSFKEMYKIKDVQLDNMFVDPNPNVDNEKDKVLVKLFVELNDEGVKINHLKDENGNIIEQVIID